MKPRESMTFGALFLDAILWLCLLGLDAKNEVNNK